MAGLVHEPSVVLVRDREPAEPERLHVDQVARALVGLWEIGATRVAPHPKRPRRDDAPLEGGGGSGAQRGITGRRMRDGRSASVYTVCSATT